MNNTTPNKETTFDKYLSEKLKDESFKAEWDALETEFSLIQASIDQTDPS